MRKARDFSVKFWLAAATLTLGCSDSNPSSPPPIRDIEVTVTTDGASSYMDTDGYTLSFDNQAGQSVSLNATVRFRSVSNGKHSLQLSGVAANCSVDGPNPRDVDVVAGAPTTVLITFTVHCAAPAAASPWDY